MSAPEDETLQEQFCRERRIDMFDFSHHGYFSYFNPNKQKWTLIARGLAWRWYAQWLEKKIEELKPIVKKDDEDYKPF
jgi:hypothetical protein